MKVYVIQKWMTRIIQNEMTIVILYRKKMASKILDGLFLEPDHTS